MAEIISDGPRAWALDVLDRKLGRALAAASGMAMLVAVFVIDPGPSRLVLALGAVVLLVRAVARERPVTHDDLAQVETLILDLRADVDERTETGYARLDRITEMIRDINGQVR